MSAELTIETIRRAKANDIEAVSEVIRAIEPRALRQVAGYASKLPSRDSHDDLAQEARLAVWDAVRRFEGDSADSFRKFVYHTVENTLKDAARDERHQGSDADALKVFGKMLLEANGDPFLAEKLCATVPPKARRLGKDRPYAARLAWQGGPSLDMRVAGSGEGTQTLLEALAADLEVPADLVTADDLNYEERRKKVAKVHAVLDAMGSRQATVLRLTFGIAAECEGKAISPMTAEDIAAELGIQITTVRVTLSAAKRSFGTRWIRLVATSAEHAQELTDAMNEQLSKR